GPNQERAALLILAAAIVILAIAWAFELIGGFRPCALCLQQREGYYAAIPLLAISFAATRLRWPACVSRGLLVVAGLMLATSLTTAIYQAGAEWNFWLGPSDCGAGGLPAVSTGNLLDEIAETEVIFCDEAALRVLGLSFAGWNVLAAGGLTVACIFAAAWAPGKRA
ncbi:MAG: disulfide bond formation protein B, partial [Devosiaceae bacterium]|nr:disulfide bond formation protein B [Devosiaceae bacterium MH13]